MALTSITKGVVVSGAFGPPEVGGPARKIAICLVVMSWVQLEGLVTAPRSAGRTGRVRGPQNLSGCVRSAASQPSTWPQRAYVLTF